MIRPLLTLIALLFFVPAVAQQYVLSGKITDNQNNPVGFTSVYIEGTTQGTSANADGNYHIKLSPGRYTLKFRFVGFKLKTETVQIGNHDDTRNINLTYEDYQLKQPAPAAAEDPALGIIRQVIAKRQQYLNEVNAYTCDVYIKGVQDFISAPKGAVIRDLAKQLNRNIQGKGILYLSESESHYSFERPDKHKEEMVSSLIAGKNNGFNFNRAADLQVNFYRNVFDIEGLNPRGFISPIADDAFKYYTYKLLGSTTENGKVIDKIKLVPLKDHSPVFKGNIYIVEGDWRIYDVHLYLTKESNLNLIDTLNINQQYIPVKGNIWQPGLVSLTYSGNVLGFFYKGHVLGVYSNYNLDPKFAPGYFGAETVRMVQQSAKADSVYWAQNRPVPLTPAEQLKYKQRDSLAQKGESPAYRDSVQRVNNRFNPIRYVYLPDSISYYKNNEAITLNPLYDAVFYNTIEGWGINLKPKFTKNFDSGRQYTISPQVRYGFENHMPDVNTEFYYTYDPLKKAGIYGKGGRGVFDINSAGSVGTFENTYNSLLFKNNYLKLYSSTFFMLGTQRQVARGLVLDGNLEYEQRTALQNTSDRTLFPFPDKQYTSNDPLNPNPNAPPAFPQNNAFTLRLSATYTFNQEYTLTSNGPVYTQSNYPQLRVNYRQGIHSLGSDVNYNYADIQLFDKRIDMGIYGYSAFFVSAGRFFNSTSLYEPDYKWFQGNLGFTFEPGISTFHFLPFYTYTPLSFFEAHYEHNFSGYFLRQVPHLQDFKLEEIIGANFLTQQLNSNYSELYVGIQRFFLRFDYGLTYGHGSFGQGVKLYFGF